MKGVAKVSIHGKYSICMRKCIIISQVIKFFCITFIVHAIDFMFAGIIK